MLAGYAALLLAVPVHAATGREVERAAVPEAHQGIAVDGAHFYAIDSAAIGKYDKKTGKRVARWTESTGGPVRHLNSGVVVDGRLYCAHSNYPDLPMTSSIEIYDTRTMEHAESHSFGISAGSATWVDFRDGAWWVVFAHYDHKGTEPGRNNRWTTLVRFDRQWQQTAGWVFPQSVLQRFSPYSNSGGSWGADGQLYVTGHSAPELYVLRLPRAGSTLDLIEIVRIPSHGQGIAWDRSRDRILYTVNRPTREVVVLDFGDDAPPPGEDPAER
jgi:hypothetical protein